MWRAVEAAVNGVVMLPPIALLTVDRPVTVLPQVRGTTPTPNFEHTLLHVLTGLAAVLTWVHVVG